MANWLRLILSVVALVGLLAAGSGGAFAKSAHHCCPEAASMTIDEHATDCGGEKGLPDCCVFGACAVLPPVAPPTASIAAPAVFAKANAAVLDDAGPPSRSPSPDLRPPIA
jgi:hypothetical protein